jgi:hypothetical protein
MDLTLEDMIVTECQSAAYLRSSRNGISASPAAKALILRLLPMKLPSRLRVRKGRRGEERGWGGGRVGDGKRRETESGEPYARFFSWG